MTQRFDGKVALVTGAGSGMGRAITLRLASEGALVVANDVNPTSLAETVTLVTTAGGRAVAAIADVSSDQQVDAMVAALIADHGHLDVVVNNAGVLDSMGPVGEVPEDDWLRVLGTNLNGVFHVTRATIDHLVGRDGAIVNIASIAGISGAKAGAAYTASKHGVVGLTRSTAFFYGAKGVRCNAVCPGGVDTNIGTSAAFINEAGMATLTKVMETAVRTGDPAEIAALVAFLASSEASLVNGAIVTADAGWTAA